MYKYYINASKNHDKNKNWLFNIGTATKNKKCFTILYEETMIFNKIINRVASNALYS